MQTYHRFPIDEFYGVLNTDEQGFSGAEAVARLQHYDANDPLYRTAITDFFSSIIICQVADV
ncbi:MAG: hypothetical protein H8E30_05665, partial [Alphaproteobacteria bacterium]|nr:hypothetical protein [Alphaproteobacteria bacterium]